MTDEARQAKIDEAIRGAVAWRERFVAEHGCEPSDRPYTVKDYAAAIETCAARTSNVYGSYGRI
jgi:hypothetical protein